MSTTVIITLGTDEIRDALAEYCKNTTGIIPEKSTVKSINFNGEKLMSATLEFEL